MSVNKNVVWIVVAFYLTFWAGGVYRSTYTHDCARSHRDTQVSPDGDESEVTVCDAYSSNGRHWTLDAPLHVIVGDEGRYYYPAFAAIGAVALAVRWRRARRRDAELRATLGRGSPDER